MLCHVNDVPVKITFRRTFITLRYPGGTEEHISVFDVDIHKTVPPFLRSRCDPTRKWSFTGNNARTFWRQWEGLCANLCVSLRIGDLYTDAASGASCPICLDALEADWCIKTTCCGGVYHGNCYNEVILRKLACPLCRFGGCPFCGGKGCEH